MGTVTILLLPVYPIIYLFFTLATMFGTSSGADVTEVRLPYDESQGIVWTCEQTDYGWFDLTDTKIDGDEQIFVFKGRNAFNYTTDNRFSEVKFTDKNSNELIYYARAIPQFLMAFSKVRMYSPDEYIIAEYTPEAKTETEGVEWELQGSESYCVGTTETDGVKTYRHVCFNDTDILVYYYYSGVDRERIRVIFSYEGNELKITEKHQIKFDGEWVNAE